MKWQKPAVLTELVSAVCFYNLMQIPGVFYVCPDLRESPF